MDLFFSDAFAQADDNGEKHLVLCRVLLGNVEKVDVGSQQCYPSSVAFDSGVDNIVNPKWYVVWTTNMNTHILPECVVSYKCSDRKQGEWRCPYMVLVEGNVSVGLLSWQTCAWQKTLVLL